MSNWIIAQLLFVFATVLCIGMYSLADQKSRERMWLVLAIINVLFIFGVAFVAEWTQNV